jgi:hypothetical protein
MKMILSQYLKEFMLKDDMKKVKGKDSEMYIEKIGKS